MKQLTSDDLDAFLRAREAGLKTPEERLLVLTDSVLVEYLGVDWVRANVYADRQAFLRVDSTETPDAFRHHDRVLTLAETLFNLQATPGIEAKVAELKTGDVESAVAELEAAMFLTTCRLRFTFRVPSGVQGDDYDMDLHLPLGVTASVEAKCKMESTIPSANTIRNVLKAARRQVRPDRPSLVFIKIPESWHDAPSSLAAMVRNGLAAGFEGSGRINAVLFHWERWEVPAVPGARRHVSFKFEPNPRARFPVESLKALLEPVSSSPWFSFMEYVGVGARRTRRSSILRAW